MDQHICKHTKSKKEAKEKKEGLKSKVAPERLFHFGHLPVFELVDWLKEEHNSDFVPFHRSDRPDEGFAMTVGQVLEKV